ncbi:MAG: DNA primase, partial [Oscillospiraceae bacterium]|nr:DNA primase [Oscillospiraceae bacterium]
FLARRAGMTVPDNDMPDELAGKRKRMLEINRDAARFFHETLLSARSVNAKKYLAERGISPKMVKTFGLGAVPDAWSSLLDAMTAKGYTRQELIEAGLARKGKQEGAAYDLFRNRLIFPVIDIRGNVIGFSGRILGDGEPKYLNSPDTLVFNKSRNLFALNLVKKSKAGMLILAEGNIDVIALHQAGFDSAVASLGTALTAEQVRLMSRYADNAVIAYDSDEAGRKAALRAIDMFEKTNMGVKVIDFGDSKDPDEFLKNHGTDAFSRLLAQSENHIEYRLMTVKNRSDLTSDEGRLKFLAETTKLLSDLASKPEREVYGARVAKIAGVSSESVENEVTKMLRTKARARRKQAEKQVTRPAQNLQPADRALRYKNEYSAAAEEGIIRCLVRDPTLLRVSEEMGLMAAEFTSEFLAKVFNIISQRGLLGAETGAALIMAALEGNEASQLTVILQKPEAIPNGEQSIRAYIERIRTEKYKSGDPDEQLLLSIKKYREFKDVGG